MTWAVGAVKRLDELDAQAGLPAEARTKGAREREGGSNSVVESQPSKLLVAGSIPVSRSILRRTLTAFAAADGKPMSAPAKWPRCS